MPNPPCLIRMMTLSNGNIFGVTGLLCGEFTGHRWIPSTKASDASFDVFFDLVLYQQLSKQWRRRWFETPLRSLWRHCNAYVDRCHSSKAKSTPANSDRVRHISWVLCQKQVSRAGTSNYTPQILWGVINCRWPWCRLLAQHPSFHRHPAFSYKI